MESKKQTVAKRFAANLVGAMLERAGTDFFQAEPGPKEAADFLVKDEGLLLAIVVKYTEDSANVSEIWQMWHQSMAKKNESRVLRLVIVTGAGDAIFTDEATAPLLAVDHRASLFIVNHLSV